jgi:cardiolipin synthase
MTGFAEQFWPHLTGGLALIVAIVASAYVVLTKRDERAAVAWIGLICLSPFIGALLFVVFGVNRIRRRATKLGRASLERDTESIERRELDELIRTLPNHERLLKFHTNLAERFHYVSYTKGNAVTPLVDGDAAFPEMIGAIDGAQRTVALSSYIFNDDQAGRPFVEALARAVKRGVEVRVLIDGVGALYSIPPIVWALRKRSVPTALFLFSFVPWRMPYLNLRNHRWRGLVSPDRARGPGDRAGDRRRTPSRERHAALDPARRAHRGA